MEQIWACVEISSVGTQNSSDVINLVKPEFVIITIKYQVKQIVDNFLLLLRNVSVNLLYFLFGSDITQNLEHVQAYKN